MNQHACFNYFIFYYSFHRIFLSFQLYHLDFFDYQLQPSSLGLFLIRIHKYNNMDLISTRNQAQEYRKNLLLYLFQFTKISFLHFLFQYYDKLVNRMNLILKILLYLRYFYLFLYCELELNKIINENNLLTARFLGIENSNHDFDIF